MDAHYVPIHGPDGPQLAPIKQAYALLLEAAKKPMMDDTMVVLSMRLASMLSIIHDGRVRLTVMTHKKSIHDVLWVRPPERWRLQRSLLQRIELCTHRYVEEMEHLLHLPGPMHVEAACMWTRHVWHEIELFWSTGLPPLPRAMTDFEQWNKNNAFY